MVAVGGSKLIARGKHTTRTNATLVAQNRGPLELLELIETPPSMLRMLWRGGLMSESRSGIFG